MELSSFQLQTFDVSPFRAVITNITLNHLDYHKDMEEYIEAKKNIFRFQDANSITVLNYDNSYTSGLAADVTGKTLFFSGKHIPEKGLYLDNENIVMNFDGKKANLLDINKIKLKGFHNVENYMAAIGAVYDIAKIEAIEKVALSFYGVEHGNEFVRKINEVEFYNDSIASTPTRTSATLSCFDKKVILIAGGYDKKIPYYDFGKVIAEKARIAVLTGPTAEKIRDGILLHDKNSSVEVINAADLEEAVNISYSMPERVISFIISSTVQVLTDFYKTLNTEGICSRSM